MLRFIASIAGVDMSAFKFAAVAALGLALTACAGDPEGTGPKEGAGTLLGAGTGALIGSAVAGPGNRLGGVVVGGLLGGLIANRIGAAMDDEDKQRAYAAQVDALERGQSGAGVMAKSGFRTLRHGGSGSGLSGRRPQLSFLHAHDLYRRPPRDRAWHRLPHPGRHLDGARLS
ncbi:MAG: glycine zipper 2TM domain-containing protein [Pseudolabrys sp.]